MKVHNANSGEVRAALNLDHPWCPPDCVLALGTRPENQAFFTAGQIPDLQAVLQQCDAWIAENDPLRAAPPSIPRKPAKTDEVA